MTEVVVAAVEVAAEAGEAGRYTGDVGRTLAAVVGKVGARIAVDAEVRGFASGWQEALGGAAARTVRAGSRRGAQVRTGPEGGVGT
nr:MULTISPECIES: hypothetical protein [unclassified Streptomyces]